MNDDKIKPPLKKSKYITYFAYGLIGLIILYVLYKIESYLLYYPIHLLLLNLLKIFISEPNYSLSATIVIVIIIYLHLILFRMTVLSIVFLLGGFAKRFIIFSYFKSWISLTIGRLTKINSLISSNLYGQIPEKMEMIESFHKNYNMNKLNGITFEVKESLFGELLNEIMYIYHKFKENNDFSEKSFGLNKFNDFSTKIETLISRLNYYSTMNYISIFTHFNYTVFLHQTTQLYIDELSKEPYNRKATLVKISKNLEGLLILPKVGEDDDNILAKSDNTFTSINESSKANQKTKTLVVMCNQNAAAVELYYFSQGNISPYIKLSNTSILLWNYPGYGNRKGFPSFSRIDEDAKNIVTYINREFPNHKIIVHGISIGGYSAIKIAKELNDPKNVVLIADRTFADISHIVSTLPYGNILVKIYKMVFPSFLYHSNNVHNYISIKGENKIVFYDEKDTIIEYKASLVQALTYEYFNRCILNKIKRVISANRDSFIHLELFDNINSSNLPKLLLEENEINEIFEKINDTYIRVKDSAKKFIKKIGKNKSLSSFLIHFFTFGYECSQFKEVLPLKEERERSFTYFPFFIKDIVVENKGKIDESILKLLSKLNYLFATILLDTKLTKNELETFNYDNNAECSLKPEIEEGLTQYFGSVHRIFCGHNGELKESDIAYLMDYLTEKCFIENEDSNVGIN